MKTLAMFSALAVIACSAPSIAQDVSVGASVSASAEVSVSVPPLEPSSQLSSASGELSSAEGQLSSMSSSEMSSEMSSSMMSSMACGTGEGQLDTAKLGTTTDAAALSAVTSVMVIELGDCENLAPMDTTTATGINDLPLVQSALRANGKSGIDVVAYSLEDTTLTIYVH